MVRCLLIINKEMNKDEADKCIRIARKAMSERDFVKVGNADPGREIPGEVTIPAPVR